MANKKHEYFDGILSEIWRLSNDVYGNPRYILIIDCPDDHVCHIYTKDYKISNCLLGSKVKYELCGRGLRQQGRYIQGGHLVRCEDKNGVKFDYCH